MYGNIIRVYEAPHLGAVRFEISRSLSRFKEKCFFVSVLSIIKIRVSAWTCWNFIKLNVGVLRPSLSIELDSTNLRWKCLLHAIVPSDSSSNHEPIAGRQTICVLKEVLLFMVLEPVISPSDYCQNLDGCKPQYHKHSAKAKQATTTSAVLVLSIWQK